MSSLERFPTWTILLLILLFCYAWRMTRTRVVSLSRLWLLPLVFLGISINTVASLSMPLLG